MDDDHANLNKNEAINIDQNVTSSEIEHSGAGQNGKTLNLNASNGDFEPSSTLPNSVASTRLYKRRWLMLGLFCCYSFSNAYQWIHLNIIATQVEHFWNASLPEDTGSKTLVVEWLSMIYMLAYIPLIIPSAWLLDHKGLKTCALLATMLNMFGAWLKVGSVSVEGDRFWLLMFAQTICAIAQVFILGIPAQLAAVWFGPNEVSRATAIGVFGNQMGVAFGFLLPPYIVPESSMDDQELLATQFRYMFIGGACIMSCLFILVCIFFKKQPPIPPSHGQLMSLSNKSDYIGSLVNLAKNRNFVLLAITYGINTGVYYAIGTLLQIILQSDFENQGSNIGWCGFTMIVAGIPGAMVGGVVLDKYKSFKLTTLIIYILSTLSMASLSGVIPLKIIWIVFVVMFLLGFFMTGYLPVGFEFAAEITYPENEGTSSGILNAMAQTFGIILTLTMGRLINAFGVLTANLAVTSCLIVGSILTGIIKNDMRRQKAHCKEFEIVPNNPYALSAKKGEEEEYAREELLNNEVENDIDEQELQPFDTKA